MAYNVYFTDVALRNLQRCSQKNKDMIFKGIEQLAEDPLNKSNVKKLVNFDTAAYRLRVGNYRILFDREDTLEIIDIIDVLQRKQAYRRR